MGRCAKQAKRFLAGKFPTETVKYQDLLCTEAEKGTAEVKGYGSDKNDEPNSKLRYNSLMWRQEECPV